MKGPANRHP
ncbi:hypothetical protein PENSTE_c022G03592 [Penicillium steckii]|uniref:Uncharacterized protein n=1 Tax=Penicillium steckii TaxID=303698 RepID=A0A1V6SSK6_9EURO|nr:hypothetical protein PENSTE_c022G03592 [Penicillium steckii]